MQRNPASRRLLKPMRSRPLSFEQEKKAIRDHFKRVGFAETPKTKRLESGGNSIVVDIGTIGSEKTLKTQARALRALTDRIAVGPGWTKKTRAILVQASIFE